jgi:hypothetical protein
MSGLVHYPRMSQPPAPYDRSYSFTDFSQSNPTTPHQGQKIDQELNNVQASLNATISRLGEIQADDGKVRTTALNLPAIAEEVEPLLTDAPVQAVEAAGAQQVGLVNDAGDAKVAELEAVLTSQNAIDAIAARDAAQSAAYEADLSKISAANSAGLANTYANTSLQAKNSAIVHAQIAQQAAAGIGLEGYAQLTGASFTGNVTSQGRMAIGGGLAVNPANKLAIYNGNVVFSSGYGIAFGDGTTQTTAVNLSGYATQSYVTSQGYITSAALSGYATEGWVNGQGFASQSDWRLTAVQNSSFIDLNNAATSGLYDFTYYDGYASVDVTTQLEIQSPVDGNNYNGYSVAFDDTQMNGYFNVLGTSVTIGIGGYYNMQDALSALNSGSSSGGWKLIGSGSPYASASVLASAGRTVYNVPVTAQPGDTLVLRNGLNSNFNEMLREWPGANKLLATDEKGNLYAYASNYYLTAGIASDVYMPRVGGTFSGKVNFTPNAISGAAGLNVGIGGTSGGSTVNGDMWITTGGANLNFRDGTGAWKVVASLQNGNVFSAVQAIDVTSTTPALRVTQKGTGNVLLVEDALNPDTTALVVEQSGNVGIGVATGFAATAKLEVVGNTKSTTLSTGAGPTFSVNSTTTHSGGSDTLDLLITINGVQYRIGLRPA